MLVAPAGAGTVTGGGEYISGDLATVTATANAGYDFSDWSGDIVSTLNPDSVFMYGDYTVTANFSSDDAYEENDTMATAYDLTLDEFVWLSTVNGLGAAFDDDWYKIEATPSGYTRIVIDLDIVDAEGDLDLYLYDSFGFQIASSTSTTDDESIDIDVGSTGFYYIKVDPFGTPTGQSYDLYWDDLLI